MNSSAQAPPALPPIQVKTIDHVTLVVADLERTRKFYVDLLGLQPTTRPGFNFPGLWFQAGATQIHLILQHDLSGPAGLPMFPPPATAGRVFHFAFEVDDCRAAVEHLKRAGVTVRGGPSLRPDGFVQTWCHDPDGHVVELFSRT